MKDLAMERRTQMKRASQSNRAMGRATMGAAVWAAVCAAAVAANIDPADKYARSSHHGQVTVNTGTGRFDGYAWGENIGWIHFRNAAQTYNVRTTAFDSAPTLPQGTIFEFQ
jgi:hypothetical protein